MSNLRDLEKAELNLRDLTAKQEYLFYHLDKLVQEQTLLVASKLQLEENIATLRRAKVIALMTEFQKARAELNMVQVQLNILATDIAMLRRACKTSQDMIDKGKQDYAKALRGLASVVIKGNFGRKDGQDPNRT